MPHIDGETLLHSINEQFPEIPVIIITAVNNLETAVNCMKFGAVDYMVKPVERSRLISGVQLIIDMQELKRQNLTLVNRFLDDRLLHPEAFADIVTRNDKMLSLFKYMEAVAVSEEPVLITGETGVGKELCAQALHRLSNKKGEFVSINVAGLDDNMFSDTLFGHLKGAFTDAHQPRKGLVEQALEGTLFLDEIGELSLASQVKLLRLLQEKEYYSLGSDRPRYARVRGLFSTNRNLEELTETGQFRKDLYYRIHTHHIRIPPLRRRRDDLPLLVDHFLNQAAAAMKKDKPAISAETLRFLSNYDFPGNVRELRAMIFDVVSTGDSGALAPDAFKRFIPTTPHSTSPDNDSNIDMMPDFKSLAKLPKLKVVEQNLIQEALNRTNGNISKAGEILGLSRQTLSKRLKKNPVK